MRSILIIDDEISILTALRFALDDEFNVFTALNESEGMLALTQQDIEIVLLDQRLGETDGLELLKNIKREYSDIIVIAMTAYGSIECAVEAMKNGAYYYLAKPIDIAGLKGLLNNAINYKDLTYRVSYLTEQLKKKEIPYGIVGKSKSLLNVCEIIDRIKDIDINVLVMGESGTGKELVVRAIHNTGNRADAPFQSVNCAAIPYNLLESELFGYEKGAFTGATKRYKGKLELANGGTMFLDEIGDMDIALQAKLLRVIQEHTVTPLGSEKSIKLDVRFVAATNKNLYEEVKSGKFRDDLYFRLNVVSITMPPLRERKEDILLLVANFINKYNKQFNKEISNISSEAATLLENYDYPGNVRELENIIEYSVALTKSKVLQISDFPHGITKKYISTNVNYDKQITVNIGESLYEIEKKVILKTIEYFKNNRTKAANVLGTSTRNIRNKLKEYQ